LGTVAKLAYRRRGPYENVEVTGYGSYVIRPYGDPTAAVIKYPTQALFPLPPAILPCTPIETPDFRYLNHSHAPLPHPLCSSFNIQMYNNMWFSSSLGTNHLPLFKFTNIPDPDSSSSVLPPFVQTPTVTQPLLPVNTLNANEYLLVQSSTANQSALIIN
jgi:hypothetical protein